MTKKQKIILAAVIFFLIVTAGAVVLFRNRDKEKENQTDISLPQTKTLTIDQLPIVKLTGRNRNRELTLYLEAAKGQFDSKVEYELIYHLEAGLSRGVMGEIQLIEDRGEREIILGTCSRGVCRYDEGVIDGEIIISLNKENQLHSFETKFFFLDANSPYQASNLKISTKETTMLIALEGGGLPAPAPNGQEIIAGPFVVTSETGSETISFELKEGLLLVWGQGSWERVENLESLPLGTYLLVSS